MDRLKTFFKYFMWVVGFYVFTVACTYIGLNSTYKNINRKAALPNEVTINIAQATKVNGRIYGEITYSEKNNLEGKYIKVDIFDKRDALIGTKYLKIENTQINEPKKFAVYFVADNIKNYTVSILDNNENTQQDVRKSELLFSKMFKNEELKPVAIILLLLGLYAVF